ncbi:hypothetical protein BDR07DRAFT_1384406 [Suillus spraguei]|nr:hypothetical protein BDR07DRAFT_1384406 [Suillus spraguei]
MSTIHTRHPRAIRHFISTFSLSSSVIEFAYNKVANNDRFPKASANKYQHTTGDLARTPVTGQSRTILSYIHDYNFRFLCQTRIHRQKVTTLVDTLALKSNWNVNITLHLLHDSEKSRQRTSEQAKWRRVVAKQSMIKFSSKTRRRW